MQTGVPCEPCGPHDGDEAAAVQGAGARLPVGLPEIGRKCLLLYAHVWNGD